jgi:general secretion pathway protein A
MYKKFFSLYESPFSISPNPKYFYLSQHHREALELIRYGINESGGFVLFTGEVGTGKTVIIRTIINDLPKNINSAFICNPGLSVVELFETICSEFGIRHEKNLSKKELIDLISSFLKEEYKKQKRALLFIDESQHLSDEAIEEVRLLTNIETDNTKLLQVILVGQPELADKLKQMHMRQIAQRITARFHLLPLSYEETDSYIRYRMQAAGCLQIIFKTDAVKLLHKYSLGIPRIINVTCDRALLIAFKEQSPYVTKEHMRKALSETLGTSSSIRNNATSSLLSGLDVGSIITSINSCYVKEILTVIIFSVLCFFAVYSVNINYGNKKGELTNGEVISRLKADRDVVALKEKLTEVTKIATNLKKYDFEKNRYVVDLSYSLQMENAWNGLLNIYGFEAKGASIDESCEYISKKEYQCFSGKSDLSYLEQYNLPVMIKLIGNDLTPFYVVLVELSKDKASILMNGRKWVVERAFIEASYEGDFKLIWPILARNNVINRASSQREINKLVSCLNNYFDEDIGVSSWNNTLVERLKEFQSDKGLASDGIAGFETLWNLMPYYKSKYNIKRDVIEVTHNATYVDYARRIIESPYFESKYGITNKTLENKYTEDVDSFNDNDINNNVNVGNNEKPSNDIQKNKIESITVDNIL